MFLEKPEHQSDGDAAEGWVVAGAFVADEGVCGIKFVPFERHVG